MAAKLVLVVALSALCRANPVLENGILYRDGRSFSFGKASSFGDSLSTAQANVLGGVGAAQAYGSTTGGAQVARDGYFYPGQSIAQAQAYDAPPYPGSPAHGTAQAVAQAHNTPYYPVPAPATIITYEQNFAPADVSSVSSASSHGTGVAESSANTRDVGGYELTSSNAKTHGTGFANSNANSGSGSTHTSARTQGKGLASSSAQNNGVVGVVYPVAPAVPVAQEIPTVIEAKTPIFHTTYVPVAPAQSVVSSNANVAGYGNAASSAKASHGRTGWHFGTFYDAPTVVPYPGYGAAKSSAHTHGFGSADANAQVNSHPGHGVAKSAAHTHGYGSAGANADVNGFGSLRSIADANSAGGAAQSYANSHDAGTANANAISSGYGNARSSAVVPGAYHGSRTSADALTQGSGHAASSARTQDVDTTFRMTDSRAHSSGFGSAQANAVTA